jgi:hypothetical protein
MGDLLVSNGKRQRRCRYYHCFSPGCYATVYFQKKKVFIEVADYRDASKTLLASLPRMRHLPELKLMGETAGGCKLFSSPRYREIDSKTRPRSKGEEACRVYAELERLTLRIKGICPSPLVFNRAIQKSKKLPVSIKQAIAVLCTAAAADHTHKYWIDFGYRNIMMDSKGDLVFIDLLAPDL